MAKDSRRAVGAHPRVDAILGNPRLMRIFGIHPAVLHYTGRRSGRPLSVTVWIKPRPDGALVTVAKPARKTWWRNFRDGAPLEVHRDGTVRAGRAVAVQDGTVVRVKVTYD